MLSEPTVGVDRRAVPLRRARDTKVPLRLALAVIAVVYVVGPTVLQWVALAGDRAAAHAEARAPATTIMPNEAAVPGRAEPSQASRPLVHLLSPGVPEQLRDYVPAALEALAGGGRVAQSGLAVALGAAVRALLVGMAAVAAVIIGARLGHPYKPRHARREGLARLIA